MWAKGSSPQNGRTMSETISMTKLTRLLNEKGIKAQFCMSGGNCGTIYIGEISAEGFAEFAVGPSNYALDEGYYGEICWGLDDDGTAQPFFFEGDPVLFTEERVADFIEEDYKNTKVGA